MARELEPYQNIERSIIKKYRKEIWSKFVKAVGDYELIKENNQNLEKQKQDLEDKITTLNTKINKVKKDIDKLK